MDIFGGVAAILMLSAISWWFMAVRMSRQTDIAEQQSLAQEQINTYRLRLRELKFEREYDELDDFEYESAVNELKRQLLFDLKAQNQADKKKQYPLFLPGMLFLVVFVGAFYYANGESNKLVEWEQAVALMPSLGERAVLNQGEPLSPKELQQFALGLRTQLFEAGDDAVAWLILGRVTLSLKDFDAALLAFEKAYNLDPEKEATLLSYSQILLMMPDRNSMIKASGLLAKVLKRQPQNIDALWMVGSIAERMNDAKQAQKVYSTILGLLPEQDYRRSSVEDSLARVGGRLPAAPVAVSTEGALSVHLSLDDSVKDKVPPGAVLFVYAKAPSGRPMPAAVIKMDQFTLPLTVELSDNNAMLPDYKLSSLKDVVIFSRISKDGNISVASGELQGQTPVFSLQDTKEVSVVINQIL